jgi:mono/diheme cytochrome c family protein
MWKKIALFLLTGIVVVIGGGLAFLYLRKPAQAPASRARVPMTAERIARGEYLFEHVADCGGCHTLRDFTRVGGPQDRSRRGWGNVVSDFFVGLPGQVVASNITPDPETGIGTWTDGEKIRAIRDGVDKNGNALFPMMPYMSYRAMCDDDIEALVAYLDTLPPVRHPLPRTKVAFPVNLLIKFLPQPAGSVSPAERADRVKYGKYLADLAGCRGCHTPEDKPGQPLPGMDFAGGQALTTKAGTVLTANITPDMETGIGKWSEEFFQKKFYEYRDYAAHESPKLAGPQAFTLMPWLAFTGLSPEDLGAIYVYLRTMKPVSHYVERHPGASKAGT